MNTRELREQLLAAQALIQSALGALPDAAAVEAPKRKLVPASEFAERRCVSLSTVKKWIKWGLPVSRDGRVVRVRVEAAEEWLDQGGGKRAALMARKAREEKETMQ